MISFNDVGFSYGPAPMLEGLSFTVRTNETFVLMGRSGVGKTTILRLILGLLKPASGSIVIGAGGDGLQVSGARVKGVLFQEETLLGWKSALQNVLLSKAGGASASDQERAKHYLRLVGLEASEDTLPKHLSYGMRKRIELARALFSDPRYLIADEPFASLDLVTKREIWEALNRGPICELKGRTNVLASHDIDEALALAHEIGVLTSRNGRVQMATVRVPEGITVADDPAQLNELKELVLSRF